MVLRLLPLLVAASLVVAAEPPAPLGDRHAWRPPWEVDLTHRLERLPRDAADQRAAQTAAGQPIGLALSRQARQDDLRPTGFSDWWRLKLELPAQADGWPVVLEMDETRAVEGAWLDGEALAGADRSLLGNRFADGQGAYLLPLSAARPAATLVLRLRMLSGIYADAVGQVRLRPAQLGDVVRLAHDRDGRQLTVRSLAGIPLDLAVHVRHEDFFGAPLGVSDRSLALAPGAEPRLELAPPAAPAWYKTRVWATCGERATWDHWFHPDPQRQVRDRDQVLAVDQGWEFASAPTEPQGFAPPAQGWHAVKLPHLAGKDDYRSPWGWYRCRVSVPAGWSAERVQLELPRALYRTVIYCDGEEVATRCNWQLPDRILLPPSVRPGATVQLHLAMWDHRVGLVPGTKAADPPATGLPGGSRAAPIDTLGLGLDSRPEIVGVPERRLEQVVVITRCPDERGAGLEVRCLTAGGSGQRVRGTVLLRGAPVLELPAVAVAGDAAVLRAAWPTARRWSPDDPVLHELRLELVDAAGAVADLRRERFGVREFGVRGDRFVLNGQPIMLLGGSHVLLSGLQWPLLPHPYRIVRHYPNAPANGFMTGPHIVHLADEVGCLVKGEDINFGALHQRRHDWTRPELYERSFEQMQAMWRRYANHPSMMMWDVGNELRYDGHAAEMGALFRRLRTLDPTRLVTAGGPFPQAEGAEVLDYHGWGSWKTRNDFWYYHPEERPSALRSRGLFNRPAAGEPAGDWRLDLWNTSPVPSTDPGDARIPGLRHQGGKPVLFSEGHYYEDGLVPELTGLDAWRPLAIPASDAWAFPQAHHFSNWLAARRLSVANVRVAGFPSAMIHVDRGLGRWIQPVAALPEDRGFRVEAGLRLRTRFHLINDLCRDAVVHGRWQLLDGAEVVAEQGVDAALPAGGQRIVDLDLAVPAPCAGRTLRLHVEAWAEGAAGGFRDDHAVTAFAPPRPVLPPGFRCAVYDPAGRLAGALGRMGVETEPLSAPAAWSGGPLLIASEALAGVDGAALAGLRRRLAAGGRAVVLDHRVLPALLSQRLVQRSGTTTVCSRLDPSPLTAGLLAEDLRHWRTGERDQVVAASPFDIPAGGNARAHLLAADGATPLLEVREGAGAAVLCQLNLGATLAEEPAARQALANLVGWLAAPPPPAPATVVAVTADPGLIATLRGRIGLDVSPAADAAALARARLVVVRGDHAADRALLEALAAPLRARLDAGATLLALGLDGDGAACLSRLAGCAVAVDEAPVEGAFRCRFDPLLAGTTHGDLWWGEMRTVDPARPAKPTASAPAWRRLGGGGLTMLTEPAVVGTAEVGQGRVVATTLRLLDQPVPSATRLLSALLSGCGARLEADGLSDASWVSTAVALDALATPPPPALALPGLPAGRAALAGVDWLLPSAGAVVAVGDGLAPVSVEIPVGRRADRLVFLHACSGAPEASYRIFYAEDRAAWIPGKPDPFIDVRAAAGSEIHALDAAGALARGAGFAGAAQPAWTAADGRRGLTSWSWDNPHPLKTIAAVQVQARGGVLLLAGLATAVRGGAPELPLAQIAPGVPAAQVLARPQGARYGAVLLRDGTVPMIHDPQGRPLFALRGWGMQGSRVRDGQTERFMVGEQRGAVIDLHEEPAPAPGTRVFSGGASAPALTWRVRYEFAPARIRAAWTYRQAAPPGEGVSIHATVALSRLGGLPFSGHQPNQVPALLPVASGIAVVEFDRSFLGWYINHHVDAGGVCLYLHPQPGQERTAWFEVVPP